MALALAGPVNAWEATQDGKEQQQQQEQQHGFEHRVKVKAHDVCLQPEACYLGFDCINSTCLHRCGESVCDRGTYCFDAAAAPDSSDGATASSPCLRPDQICATHDRSCLQSLPLGIFPSFPSILSPSRPAQRQQSSESSITRIKSHEKSIFGLIIIGIALIFSSA